jgi:hypothetical protein
MPYGKVRAMPPQATSRWRWIAPASVMFLGIVFALHRIEDFDVWFHLAAGRLMLATGTWPASNTFALTSPEHPWVDLHWIFQLLLYGAWSLAGIAGTIVLVAALVAATTLVLYGIAQRWVPPMFAAFLLAVALTVASPRFEPRPETMSFLYFAIYLLLLEGYPRNGKAIYWLVPLQILWVNTQGIFAVGLALIGCYWAGATLAFLPLPRGWREETSLGFAAWRRLTVVLAVATIGCLLNPWGVEGALFPIQLFPRVTGSSLFSSRIGEFRAPLSSGYAPPLVYTWVALLVATGVSFVVNIRRWHLGRLLAALAFGILSTQSLRNMTFAAWIAVPVIAANLGWLVARWRLPAAVRTAFASVALAAIVVMAAVVASNQWSRVLGTQREFGMDVSPVRFPTDAVAFIEKAGIKGRAFNCLAMGGYLTWMRPNDPVFVDGRLEAFPESVFRRYFAVMDQPDAWPQMIGGYTLDYALLYHAWSNRIPLVRYLALDHGWTLVYYDEVASIFVPNDDAHREMRERALGEFNALRAARMAEPDPAPPSDLARMISFPVGEAWRQRSYGNVLRTFSFPDEAARAFRRSLALDPDQIDTRANLGFAYWELQRREDAIREWRETLRRDPTNRRVQDALARVAGIG